MQRVKTKTFIHFCSLQQAKVILFVLSPKRGTLANSEGRDELPQAQYDFSSGHEHYILEINKISKAEKTLFTIKLVCFVFCWNILEIFFANSVV